MTYKNGLKVKEENVIYLMCTNEECAMLDSSKQLIYAGKDKAKIKNLIKDKKIISYNDHPDRYTQVNIKDFMIEMVPSCQTFDEMVQFFGLEQKCEGLIGCVILLYELYDIILMIYGPIQDSPNYESYLTNFGEFSTRECPNILGRNLDIVRGFIKNHLSEE